MQTMQTIVVDDVGRLGLIDMVIGMLEKSGDPRAPGAIAGYRRQRAEVEARLAGQPVSETSASSVEPSAGQPVSESLSQPPAQIVGMQTLRLRGN